MGKKIVRQHARLFHAEISNVPSEKNGRIIWYLTRQQRVYPNFIQCQLSRTEIYSMPRKIVE